MPLSYFPVMPCRYALAFYRSGWNTVAPQC